ncbi:ribosomal protein S5 domain 2-type protein [Globomyces pollinis-pini]|nr:ribosomal protein S5 domain 2-type protein [Globomyces pollinis-pini]
MILRIQKRLVDLQRLSSLGPRKVSYRAVNTIHHSDIVIVKKSKFQSSIATIKDKQDMDTILKQIHSDKLYSKATHQIHAFRYKNQNGNIIQGFDNDGETGAGSSLLRMLELSNTLDVVVIVTRWYGGVKIGPERFRIINNVAMSLLKKHGFMK